MSVFEAVQCCVSLQGRIRFAPKQRYDLRKLHEGDESEGCADAWKFLQGTALQSQESRYQKLGFPGVLGLTFVDVVRLMLFSLG